MRLRFVILSVAGLWAFALGAAPAVQLDSLTAGSTTYREVTVLSVSATDLFFTHSGGSASVKLKYLSPELQQRFHFKAESAAAAEQHQSEQALRYEGHLASNLWAQADQASQAARRAAFHASVTSEENLADPVSTNSLLGQPLPSLQVEKWLGEEPALENKCRLVAFWAPWSIPCRKWLPQWNAWQQKYAEQLQVIGISTEPEEDILALAERKIQFACGFDPLARLSRAAGVTSVPTVLLVDRQGVVRYQGHPGALSEGHLQSFFAHSAETSSQGD